MCFENLNQTELRLGIVGYVGYTNTYKPRALCTQRILSGHLHPFTLAESERARLESVWFSNQADVPMLSHSGLQGEFIRRSYSFGCQGEILKMRWFCINQGISWVYYVEPVSQRVPLYLPTKRSSDFFCFAPLPLHLIGVGVIQQRGGKREVRLALLPLPPSVYLRGDCPLFRGVKSMHHYRRNHLSSPLLSFCERILDFIQSNAICRHLIPDAATLSPEPSELWFFRLQMDDCCS